MHVDVCSAQAGELRSVAGVVGVDVRQQDVPQLDRLDGGVRQRGGEFFIDRRKAHAGVDEHPAIFARNR